MNLLKNLLEDKKIIIMSWICFIMSMVLVIRTPESWEMITLLLAFSFFPNLMKEFIIRKYNLPEEEAKNAGDK